MSNATHGNYAETGEKMMAYYDQLPPALREVHRNSISIWACGPDLRQLRKALKQGESEESYVNFAVRWHIESDAAAVREDAKKDWGIQAPAYVEAQRCRKLSDWLDKPPRSKL